MPEQSKLSVRIVSRDPAEVTLATGAGTTALAPAWKAIRPIPAPLSWFVDSGDVIRSYETVLDSDVDGDDQG